MYGQHDQRKRHRVITKEVIYLTQTDTDKKLDVLETKVFSLDKRLSILEARLRQEPGADEQ